MTPLNESSPIRTALLAITVLVSGCGQASPGRADERGAAAEPAREQAALGRAVVGVSTEVPHRAYPRETKLTAVPRWRHVTTPTTPPARSAAGFTYLPGLGTVLFGGAACVWPCKPRDDLWRFDGADWALLQPTSSTGLLPVAYPAFTAVPGTTSLRLAGGFTGQTQTDRELYYATSGAVWVTMPKSPLLLARDSARMAPAGDGQGTLLFGGETPSGLGAGTWLAAAGMQQFATTPDVVEPPPRRDHAMTTDTSGARVLLFGGRPCARGQSCAPLGDLWSRGTSGGWTEPTTTGAAPSARYGHGLVFDDARGVAVLFGGRTESALLGDTWELEGGTWTLTVPAGKGPSARAFMAMAYDADREVTVLFGGQGQLVDPESTNDHLDDTWEYGPVDLTCTSDATCDTGHCVDGVCCETASCGTCESCATLGAPGVCAPIDGPDPDSCASSCVAGVCGLPRGSSCAGASECADGFCAGGVCCESACTGECDSCATGTCETRTCNVPAGSACGAGDECASGFCVEGVCCESACTGECESCATGTCEPRPAGTLADGCAEGSSCDGTHAECQPGIACATAAQCPSGICIGGRCCASLDDCGTECTADGSAEIQLASGVQTPCPNGCWFGRCAAEPVDCRVRGAEGCPKATICGRDGKCLPVKPLSGAGFEPSTSTGCLCEGAGRGGGAGSTSGWAGAALLVGAALARRRRGATVVGVAAAPLFTLGGCTVYDVDAGEPCRQAGYSIASRIYACTGDEAKANAAYERFSSEYACLLPAEAPSSYACAIELNDATCTDVEQRGDDLDRWVGSSRECVALLSGATAIDEACRPLAEIVAPKMASCAFPETPLVTVVARALGELSEKGCVPAAAEALDACRDKIAAYTSENGCAGSTEPNDSAVSWATRFYDCEQLVKKP